MPASTRLHPESKAAAKQVSVAQAKAHLSALITSVEKKHKSVTILRRGVPVAQITPLPGSRTSLIGSMAGTARELGDIVSPLPEEEWIVNDWPPAWSADDSEPDEN